MKAAFLIVGAFATGLFFSAILKCRIPYYHPQWMMYLLYLLLIFVGLSVGSSGEVKKLRIGWKPQWILLPLATIIGTSLGVLIAALFLPDYRLNHLLAIGSGMGYYSLSSAIISEYAGIQLGILALLTNLIREFLAIGLAGFWNRFLGPYSLISAGGATTADTTLPIIVSLAGNQYMLLSIFHGLLVDLTVPVLVVFWMSLS